MKLREGVTFHNGEPFDADGGGLQRQPGHRPRLQLRAARYFDTIAGAEAVDATTVRITTSGPDPILPTRLYWLKMVPPVASAEAGFAESPVGIRPLQVRQLEPRLEHHPDRQRRLLGRRARGRRGRVPLHPRVRAHGSRACLSGEVDLITNLLPEFVEQVPQVVRGDRRRAADHPPVRRERARGRRPRAPGAQLRRRQGGAGRGALRRLRRRDAGPAAGAVLLRLQPGGDGLPLRPREGAGADRRGRRRGRRGHALRHRRPLAEGPRAGRGGRGLLGGGRAQAGRADRRVRRVPRPLLRPREPARTRSSRSARTS